MDIDGLLCQQNRSRAVPEVIPLRSLVSPDTTIEGRDCAYTIYQPLGSDIEANWSEAVKSVPSSEIGSGRRLLQGCDPLQHLPLEGYIRCCGKLGREKNDKPRFARTVSVSSENSQYKRYASIPHGSCWIPPLSLSSL